MSVDIIACEITTTNAEAVTAIIAEHAAAQSAKDNAVGHAIRAGELLLQVKAQLAHGDFLPWIAANLPFSRQTAVAYMTVAKQLAGPNVKRAEHLSIRQVLSINKEGAVNFPNAAQLAKGDGDDAASPPQDDIPAPPHKNTPRAETAEYIKALLAKGHNVEQITSITGRHPQTVRNMIREYNLATLSRRGKNTASISPLRVISEMVNALTGAAHGVRLIRDTPIEIDKDDAAELLADLRKAMKSVNRVALLLKEAANG